MGDEPKVEIPLTEIYNQMQDLSKTVSELNNHMKNLESVIKQASDSDKRSLESQRELKDLRKV